MADGAGFDDAGTDVAVPPLDAAPRDGDAGAQRCTSLAGEPFGDGWRSDVSGGGSLAFTTFMGRSALETTVDTDGQRAVVARTLNMPPDGAFGVSIPLVIAGTSNGSTGSLVEVVTLACTNPTSKVRLYLAPDAKLYVEASPPASAAGTTVFAVPTAWSEMKLDVTDTIVAVTFGGQTRTVALDAAAAYRKSVGCVLTIGAAATSNVAPTTVRAEKVCLDGL